jgi:hypothetical protein
MLLVMWVVRFFRDLIGFFFSFLDSPFYLIYFNYMYPGYDWAQLFYLIGAYAHSFEFSLVYANAALVYNLLDSVLLWWPLAFSFALIKGVLYPQLIFSLDPFFF